MKKTKKLLGKDNSENVVVHVVFRGKFNEEYECVGVLTKEERKSIRVAFGAKDNKVVDSLNIRRSNIISLDILDSSKIKRL